jgi:hypothetical protein
MLRGDSIVLGAMCAFARNELRYEQAAVEHVMSLMSVSESTK